MWVGSMKSPMCTSVNEELGILAENYPLKVRLSGVHAPNFSVIDCDVQ